MMAENNTSYPVLNIHLGKLGSNIQHVVKRCSNAGIDVCGVVKGFNGKYEAVEQFVKNGCIEIGTSRVHQVKEWKAQGLEAECLLLRIPMTSELEEVVEYVDTSLNSDLDTLRRLNEIAEKKGKVHKVILMVDLGDLREGFWDKEELSECAWIVENELKNLKLRGVGTNLGCYGSIRPTVQKMDELIQAAETVEKRIGRTLETISGGATTSYPLVLEEKMPQRVNHLRIGEGITCAYDLPKLWGLDMKDKLYLDSFTFDAQIVEIREKPTHPVGEICVDCFGGTPEYTDRGIRRRALLGAGRLDFGFDDKIFPVMEGVEVIGSSSDHLIVDVEDCRDELKIGDVIRFTLSYPSVMYLTCDPYVTVKYIY